MSYRYFKEGDAVEDRGQTHRIDAENATPWLLKRLDNSWQLASGEISNEANPIEGITVEAAEAIRTEAETAGVVFKFKEVTEDDWTAPSDSPKSEGEATSSEATEVGTDSEGGDEGVSEVGDDVPSEEDGASAESEGEAGTQ